MTGYRIKDVAERSGFTAATLRYYEEIGLLPEVGRTAAGYRLYDDNTLDRLAFIARAKQLGCSLEEIADLTIAWDGGRCGPVQDRLRSLVGDKLATAQQQIVELMTLTAELHRAASTLELHRPDGPCDERCGCIASDESEPPTAQAVTLGSKPVDIDGTPPIACTLGAESFGDRLDEWRRLLTHVVQREPVERGMRATFAASAPLDDLLRLAVAEQDCCRFFDFAITIDDRGIALEVRAPDEALPVVQSLFGVAT
ncbi:MAG TPA: MerR family transcriptional regulator [Ilumatobacteraceae bacterium]